MQKFVSSKKAFSLLISFDPLTFISPQLDWELTVARNVLLNI